MLVLPKVLVPLILFRVLVQILLSRVMIQISMDARHLQDIGGIILQENVFVLGNLEYAF
jgi:hypothetical protein